MMEEERSKEMSHSRFLRVARAAEIRREDSQTGFTGFSGLVFSKMQRTNIL